MMTEYKIHRAFKVKAIVLDIRLALTSSFLTNPLQNQDVAVDVIKVRVANKNYNKMRNQGPQN